MPPSRRTGVSRPVAKPAAPSIPKSTQASASAVPPRAAPVAPHSATPMGAPPPAMAPPPAQAPAAAGGGGGMLSGLAGSVMQGMALGTGSAMANRAIDSVMGPRQVEHVHSGQAPAPAAEAPAAAASMCGSELKSFQECVTNAGGDVSACQFYMDMLTQCKSKPAFPSA